MKKGVIGQGANILDFLPAQTSTSLLQTGTDDVLGGTIGTGQSVFDIVNTRLQQTAAERGRPVNIARPLPRPTVPARPDRSAVYEDIIRRENRLQQGQLSPIAARRQPTADEIRRQRSQLNMVQPSGSVEAPAAPQRSDILKFLYSDPLSAKGQALQAAAAQGLALSGYHDRPVTFGQIAGSMMQAGQQAYQQQIAAEQEAALKQQQLQIEREKLAAKAGMPLSQAGKAAMDAGLTAGTKEYADFIKNFNKEETISGTLAEANAKALVERQSELDAKTAVGIQYKTIEERSLDAMRNNVPIGPVNQFLLPFSKIARDIGLLNQEQSDRVSQADNLQAAFKVVVPQMRVEGSGATSNFEMDFYEKSAPNFNNSHISNIILSASAQQSVDYEQRIHDVIMQEFEATGKRMRIGEAAKIVEDQGFSMFRTPLGEKIVSASLEEVEAEMIKMVENNVIEAGNVVYLGKHAGGEMAVGGFQYITQEYLDALMQE